MIAIAHALPEEIVWKAYLKLNSIDKILALVESGKLSKINDLSNDLK